MNLYEEMFVVYEEVANSFFPMSAGVVSIDGIFA